MDNCILYIRASITEWMEIKEILSNYEKDLGQILNKHKVSIFFSKATPERDKLEVIQATRDFICKYDSKYLGLSAFVSQSKYNTFRGLKERIWQQIHRRENKFLFQAGREILIKAVLQSILVFIMNVFRLPKKLCHEIIARLSSFWWKSKGGKGKLHWPNWNRLQDSKFVGGMAFWDLEKFNLAMLAKKLWRITQQPSSLVATILKEKYFKNGTLMDAQAKSQSSYT